MTMLGESITLTLAGSLLVFLILSTSAKQPYKVPTDEPPSMTIKFFLGDEIWKPSFGILLTKNFLLVAEVENFCSTIKIDFPFIPIESLVINLHL